MSEGSDPSVCPCGRSHAARRRPRKRPGMADHAKLVGAISDARASGKAVQGNRVGEWDVNYAHDCERPIRMKRSADSGALFATMWVRCRTCKPCRRANTWRWARNIEGHILDTEAKGRRTWFGTLTLSQISQDWVLRLAREAWLSDQDTGFIPDWWDDPLCDFRFGLQRAVLVRECQLYWKRLRKAKCAFDYCLVFERHKSGLPHMHFMLHETGDPITKASLDAQWHHGFTKMKLVDLAERPAIKAAFYAAKYLQKSSQARQIASLRYDLIKYPLKG